MNLDVLSLCFFHPSWGDTSSLEETTCLLGTLIDTKSLYYSIVSKSYICHTHSTILNLIGKVELYSRTSFVDPVGCVHRYTKFHYSWSTRRYSINQSSICIDSQTTFQSFSTHESLLQSYHGPRFIKYPRYIKHVVPSTTKESPKSQ